MSWKDRLISGKIKTPDGNIFTFDFEDIEYSFEKNTSEYSFADNQGSLVQDFGLKKYAYPIVMYFTGEDCDLNANAFEESAIKKGICILTHPVKGDKNVIITGASRQDNFKSSYNQVVFNVAMTETLLTDIPETTTQLKTQTEQKQSELEEKNSKAFASSFVASKLSDATNAKNRLLNGIRTFKSAVNSIASTVREISDTIEEVSSFIEENIDYLMTKPLELAGAVQRLYNTPARCYASVQNRINGYLPAYQKLLNEIKGTNSQNTKNEIAEKSLIGNCIISTMAEIFVNPDPVGNGEFDYITRNDAIRAAQSLKEYLLEMQNAIDIDEANTANYSLNYKFAQDSEIANLIRDIVNDSLKVLISQSFELKTEKTIVTDKDRTIIDLCYELYGTNDYLTLDFFCNSNNLTGENLIIIPQGTVIKYYA